MLQIGSLALMSALQFNGNNQKWEELQWQTTLPMQIYQRKLF